jgi:hypothetical protein
MGTRGRSSTGGRGPASYRSSFVIGCCRPPTTGYGFDGTDRRSGQEKEIRRALPLPRPTAHKCQACGLSRTLGESGTGPVGRLRRMASRKRSIARRVNIWGARAGQGRARSSAPVLDGVRPRGSALLHGVGNRFSAPRPSYLFSISYRRSCPRPSATSGRRGPTSAPDRSHPTAGGRGVKFRTSLSPIPPAA